MTLADIGTGDGLVAFGAISRIGSSLSVILTDLSQALLSHTEQRAIELGVRQRRTTSGARARSCAARPAESLNKSNCSSDTHPFRPPNGISGRNRIWYTLRTTQSDSE